jgi:hypothetical protein
VTLLQPCQLSAHLAGSELHPDGVFHPAAPAPAAPVAAAAGLGLGAPAAPAAADAGSGSQVAAPAIASCAAGHAEAPNTTATAAVTTAGQLPQHLLIPETPFDDEQDLALTGLSGTVGDAAAACGPRRPLLQPPCRTPDSLAHYAAKQRRRQGAQAAVALLGGGSSHCCKPQQQPRQSQQQWDGVVQGRQQGQQRSRVMVCTGPRLGCKGLLMPGGRRACHSLQPAALEARPLDHLVLQQLRQEQGLLVPVLLLLLLLRRAVVLTPPAQAAAAAAAWAVLAAGGSRSPRGLCVSGAGMGTGAQLAGFCQTPGH